MNESHSRVSRLVALCSLIIAAEAIFALGDIDFGFKGAWTFDNGIGVGGQAGLDLPVLAEGVDFYGGQAIYDVFAEAAAEVNPDFLWGPTMTQTYADVSDGFQRAVTGQGTLEEALQSADADGDVQTAVAAYANALNNAPDDQMVALRAYREALAAGDEPLATRAARRGSQWWRCCMRSTNVCSMAMVRLV